ncbi:MAG: MEDS domain-containing protein [Gammaproteobacteria bacterium]
MSQEISNHSEWLNIHQAAKLLQVSAVSLRRWTDSGRLNCYRIGGKRERRFRQEDLIAFLKDYRGNDACNSEDAVGKHRAFPVQQAAVTLAGITIEYGNHLCSLYESDKGRLKMAVPFLAEGLRRGDICYLIATGSISEKIITALRKVEPGVDKAIVNGGLNVSDGAVSAEAMYIYFENELFKSTQSGEHAVRVLGDMAWFLDRGLDTKELIDFEKRYNHSLAHRFPVVSLCQYDARRFDGSGILNALRCHEDTFAYPLSRFIGIQ